MPGTFELQRVTCFSYNSHRAQHSVRAVGARALIVCLSSFSKRDEKDLLGKLLILHLSYHRKRREYNEYCMSPVAFLKEAFEPIFTLQGQRVL